MDRERCSGISRDLLVEAMQRVESGWLSNSSCIVMTKSSLKCQKVQSISKYSLVL